MIASRITLANSVPYLADCDGRCFGGFLETDTTVVQLISSMRSALLAAGLLLGAAPTGNLAIYARLSGGGWDTAIGTELEVLHRRHQLDPAARRQRLPRPLRLGRLGLRRLNPHRCTPVKPSDGFAEIAGAHPQSV